MLRKSESPSMVTREVEVALETNWKNKCRRFEKIEEINVKKSWQEGRSLILPIFIYNLIEVDYLQSLKWKLI